MNNIVEEIEKILKDITNNDIDYDSRYKKAFRELLCIKDQLEEIDEIEFSNYIYCVSLLTDACNNIAHDCNNYKIKHYFFDLKSISIENIEREIHKNRDNIDIISGYQYDWSSGSQLPVYIVDIPGVGQVSWHINLDTKVNLDELEIEEYPYKIEKEGDFVSDLLLYNTRQKPRDIPHNHLVQIVPEGEENTLRRALDIFEMYKNNCRTELGRENIIKRLGEETYLSETMIEALSDMLDISYKDVKKYKEKNKKLEPYKALCNVFCIVHDKYKNVEKIEDINEALNMYKYIEHELKCLM